MNVTRVFSESAEKYRDKPAVIFEGRSYSFKKINEEIKKRIPWLQEVGVQNGDRIAIQLPKCMEFIFLHLAVLSIGGIILPLNPDYTAEEVTYFVSDSGSSLFFTDVSRLEHVQKTLEGIEGVSVNLLDNSSPEWLKALSLKFNNLEGNEQRNGLNENDDVAFIFYTSGTTGKPKGAMITHENLMTTIIDLNKVWEWTDQDVLLHVLPLFHGHGLWVALFGSLYAGSTIIMHEKFDPKRTWKTISNEKISLFMAVPTIYSRLMNIWDDIKPDVGNMRLFISGSAPLSENLFRRFEEASGHRLLERYGMTESGMITSNPVNPQERVAKSVGYALPSVQIRVVSSKGEDVKPGNVGEVWIKGKSAFKGYWHQPEKTRESFEEGWFKTGDLGYQDPKDSLRLYLVGRTKELIISGGYNVYPKEVENILEQHEAIQEVAVIGLPDEDFGERVTAVVVLKKDQREVHSEKLIAFCKEHLASYKCPKKIIEIDSLPRNALGKVQKHVIKQRYLNVHMAGI